MKTFTALIDINDANGQYEKVEHLSVDIDTARAELEEKYGLGKVFSISEPVEYFKP